MKNNFYHTIILARGGSKGIKNKNIIKINKKPLLHWSIQQSLKSKKISYTWVSSDSKKILNIARKLGAKIIKRPKKISCDKSSSEEGWHHAIKYIENKNYKINKIVAIQATSPLRESKDLDNAIKVYNNKKLDSLFSSTRADEIHFSWSLNKNKIKPRYNVNVRTRKQNLCPVLLENGSFYIFDKIIFLKKKKRLHGKVGTFIMPKIKSLQIDSLEDLSIARCILHDNFYKKKFGYFT